ncbi:GNAT family N-acetyltransferase [Blautia schinkii]|nr:GNAT family N-acetyltransferase [Blautia schinkii]
MELIFDYMGNDLLRYKLNDLTQKIYGFDFESWMTGGYFEGDYIPYSFMQDGKILANVSVNKMHFIQNGVHKYYIQLGTVMTDKAFRNQGLAGKLIKHILEEYTNKCDGIYLFSNQDALGFYRKIGFKESNQYQYSLKTEWSGRAENGCAFRKTCEHDEQIKQKYMDAVRNCAVNSALEHINKFGLQMFYTANLQNVYYADDIDCFAIIEKIEGTLFLQSIISKQYISMKDVISHIDAAYDSLILGFPPASYNFDMFEASVYDDKNDTRLFYCGKDLESIEKERLIFPRLSHA